MSAVVSGTLTGSLLIDGVPTMVTITVTNKDTVASITPVPAQPVRVMPGQGVDVLFVVKNAAGAILTGYTVISSDTSIVSVVKITGGIRLTGGQTEGSVSIVID